MKTHFLLLVFSLSISLLSSGDTAAQTGSSQDLFAAAKSGNVQEVRRLLAAGADVNGRDDRGAMPLFWAAGTGSTEIAELLIARGAEINATDRAGFTPLHLAAYWSHRGVAELLVLKGAKVNARSTRGYTPLHKAMERIADPHITPHQAPPSDVEAMMSVVELLLANGADVDARDGSDTTPLHFAAGTGQKALVELLIAKGADIHAKAQDSVTPLYAAAKLDRPEVAELLIARGADVNARTKSLFTPLIWVAHQGNRDFALLLIVHGADVNAKDNNGRTPLVWALLTAEFASPVSSIGQAMLSQHLSQLSPAQQAQFRNELKGMKGQWREVANLLINHGADTNADSKHNPPLYLAANMGDKDLVEALVDHGAEINFAPPCCESALHAAIAEKHGDVAELLIKKGANVNARNRSQRTPLHFVAYYTDDRKLAELMIERGANSNAKDKNGQTPIDFATNAGNNHVAEVLRRKAAGLSAIEAHQAGYSYFRKRMYAEAMERYRIAAEQNYAPAQNSIGWLYANGWGVTKDYVEAMRWYRKAVEQNHAAAQNNIGWLYRNGWGVAQDDAEAMRWFQKAAEQNFGLAQNNIGWLYLNGWGVTKDYAEAMRWFRKAAEQNNALAQTNIGYMYEQGLGGIGRDLDEARKWYRKAAEQGNDVAKRNLERLGVGEGALIQMKTYSVATPAGDGWKTQRDQAKDMVLFRRDDPLTIISVGPGYLRGTPDPTDDEDRVAAMIFAGEEKNMTDRGRSRSYAPTDITKDVRIIHGRRLHIMRYSIMQDGVGASREPSAMKYAMYIYLPPNWNQSGKFYGFLIGAPQKIGEITYDPKLSEIDSVIATFQPNAASERPSPHGQVQRRPPAL